MKIKKIVVDAAAMDIFSLGDRWRMNDADVIANASGLFCM